MSKGIRPLVPTAFPVPNDLHLAGIRMRPLRLDDLVADFEAVIESRARLRGLFAADDPWPDGLTIYQNAVDLGWLEKEFQRRSSFAWGLWDGQRQPEEGAYYLGTAYLYPDPSGEFDAVAVHWIRSRPDLSGILPGFATAWRDWIETAWPFQKVRFVAPEDKA